MSKFIPGLVAAAVLSLAASAASANDFSFTGNFATDDDVQLFDFSVGAASTVTLRTWSYAGGVNAAGAVIARGGFDPILALFDSTGLLIDQNDDGGPSYVAADAVTGAFYDTFLSSTLAAGSYTVAVMQFANFANGPTLADGFTGSGTTNFVDATGDTRDSHWAFDVLNVNSAVVTGVPEPESYALMALGLGVLGLLRRRAS